MADYYSIFILVHLLFNPVGQSGGETADVQSIYSEGQQCADAMMALTKLNQNPLEKWGCVEAIHPADDKRVREQYKSEGSH